MRQISNSNFITKYYLYKKTIYNIAFTYVHNSFDAEDIVQDVFMKYLNSNETFQTLDNERFWIVRVTINTAKSYLRKTWKQRVVLNDDILNNVEARDDVVNNEMFEIICSLPHKYKEVILLYYYEDMKINDISKTLNITESNVKKRLERARNLIKEKETKNGLFR